MDELKIWALEDASSVVELEPQRQMEAESLLEDTLVANPDLLMPGLKLVGRQTSTAGGPLDLLGVDRYGRLSLFELKRGNLTREAVAQVIDYAADLEAMDLVELAGLLAKESGERGIDEIEDFEEWYGQRFGEQELTSLRPLRMFLVGLGADERAERMVDFLANNSGMDISLITFHGFAYGGKTLFARQVHVEGVAHSESRSGRRYVSVTERRARLDERVEEPCAKALCLNEFEQPIATIPHATWPYNRDPLADADAAVHLKLTAETWGTHEEMLTRLARAVYEAYQAHAANRGHSMTRAAADTPEPPYPRGRHQLVDGLDATTDCGDGTA